MSRTGGPAVGVLSGASSGTGTRKIREPGEAGQSGAGAGGELVRQSAGDPESEIKSQGYEEGSRWKCNGEVHGTEVSARVKRDRADGKERKR